MSLLFYTGFDYYDTPQVNRVWPQVSNGVSLNPGRFAGRAWGWNNQGGYLAKDFTNTNSTIIVGMAFYLSYGDPTNPILVLQDCTLSKTSPLTQVDLRVTTDAGFQVTRNGTVIVTTLPGLFSFGFWNFLELRVDISSASGYVEIRVNGQSLFSLGGLNTKNTGNSYVNMIRLQPFESTGNFNYKVDDLYVLNGAGSVNNQFLGECRVATQNPVANGETTTFSVTGAANNWQAVDDVTPDDDASYVRSAVVGGIDDYQFASLTVTGSIYAVQVNLMQRKDDVGGRTICPLLHSGGVFYQGTNVTCQSDYTCAQNIWEIEPHSGASWTNGTVNALTAGIKITG